MAKTYNISPTSGNTERDGVNAHVAKNEGPSTPVYIDPEGKVMPNFGGTRIKNIKWKPGSGGPKGGPIRGA